MKTALVFGVFAALLVSTYAYCPNLCSGHGSCTSEDKCSCYTQKGTDGGGDIASRVAWTGPDCSLHTCPVAPSFVGATPVALTNVLALASINADGGYFATTAAWNAVGEFAAAGAGYDPVTECKRGTEVQIYKTADTRERYSMTVYSVVDNAGAYEVTFFEALPAAITTGTATAYSIAFPSKDDTLTNSLLDKPATVRGVHAKMECSGQGICDRSTGKCECFPGYGGEACTRTTCPNDCSGHGVCLSLRRLAEDASDAWDATHAAHTAAGGTPLGAVGSIITYNGWDADKEYGCKCDSGFRGPSCSLVECPSFTDPMYGCGGGPCNAAYTSVSGANTPLDLSTATVTYPAGIRNVVYSPCSLNSRCFGNEQRDCSGRGLCDYETGLCKCFSGFFGEACHIQTILV